MSKGTPLQKKKREYFFCNSVTFSDGPGKKVIKMLDSQYVRDTCRGYTSASKPTIKGLGVQLDNTCYLTLHRIEVAEYERGKPYSKKPSWNRRIDTRDFKTVARTMQKIRDLRQGNGITFKSCM